jgi:predicted RNase H-like HicB family nuclease
MKKEDQYLKFVRWSDEDNAYVGYCPDLFPWGGVCHGEDEEQTYRQLRNLVRNEIEDLLQVGKELPVPLRARCERQLVLSASSFTSLKRLRKVYDAAALADELEGVTK